MEHIKTKADLMRGIENFPDSGPVQFFLNGVAAKAYFLTPSGEGDNRVIVIEPNYTCYPEKSA